MKSKRPPTRDPRTLHWLRKIDTNVTATRIELQRALLDLDEEQEEQNSHLGRHDAKLADHERRLVRLERKR